MEISISLGPMRRPCMLSQSHPLLRSQMSTLFHKSSGHYRFESSLKCRCTSSDFLQTTFMIMPAGSNLKSKLGRRWTEYQGIHNWDGLLDPLDNHLRTEILRYGRFVEAAYESFEFDTFSPFYGTCRHPKTLLLNRSGLPETGYRVTKYLRATSSIDLPGWVEKAANSAATRSSWIGYVAVCDDKKEIDRLGRRDIVIAFRGTATCLEWLENLRTNLTHIPGVGSGSDLDPDESVPMVESGFMSLYSSGTATCPSLKQMIREEVSRLLHTYADEPEPLSLTITGHSLGAALATLTAYDVNVTFEQSPLITVVSFGGPRVGNRGFRRNLEKQGTKVLRIVNSDDVVTKVPGLFVLNETGTNHQSNSNSKDDGDEVGGGSRAATTGKGIQRWIQRHVEKTKSKWLYAEVGKELRLNIKNSAYPMNGINNIATHHDLKTYLHLVQGFVSSKSQLDISNYNNGIAL